MATEKYILIIFGLLFTVAIIAMLIPRPMVEPIRPQMTQQEACIQAEKDNVLLASCTKPKTN